MKYCMFQLILSFIHDIEIRGMKECDCTKLTFASTVNMLAERTWIISQDQSTSEQIQFVLQMFTSFKMKT